MEGTQFLWKDSPSALLPSFSCAMWTSLNCLSSVSLLPPTLHQIRAIIQGQWGPMAFFILQQRGKADNMDIYITPAFQRPHSH